MIFRLEYCNKDGDTARVDIQKGDATVTTVEGTGNPFVLFYNNDKDDKSGSFRSSGADINIYETDAFNIDELKTSSETEISVKYYINSSLVWSGFVIPDFFSKQIDGSKGVVSMVASDRLGTLKGVTLSDLPAKVSNRQLVQNCLAETGLTLPLYTMADFVGGGSNFFESQVLSQRMIDTRGRSISCYDILSSILEETNSLLLQRNGAWYIINKLQLEAGSGSLYSNATTSTAWVENAVNFNEVTVGARRTIMPVAASVGVYHEHGGGRMHPDNYDFSKDAPGSTTVTGWHSVGGFVSAIDNRKIESYTIGGSGGAMYLPNYGIETDKSYLINLNEYRLNTNPIYLESDPIDIPYTGSGAINIEVDVNGIGPAVYPNFSGAYMRLAVVAVKGSTVLTLAHGGTFIPMPSENPPFFEQEFERSLITTDIPAISKGMKIKGTLEVTDDLSAYDIKLRIYGSGSGRAIIYNSISLVMKNSLEIPKGTIYKREQGANYTKVHDIPTVLWGDYLTNGLNGYFYEYPIDDTSSLYHPNGALHSKWTAYGDTEQLPLLQHVTRQKSRMFSVAHDLLSAEIAVKNFDPLSIFVDCAGKRYVVVSAKFDFFRSVINAELEQVAYSNNIVRDFIYSYFGEGESGVKSIGGISGGGTTGGGGGLTTEQLTILNDVNNRAHDHENKAILDEVTQEIIDNSHAHNNLSILNQITQEIINNAMREMIKENSSTPLTDENYLSSLRTIKEIAERAISKLNPDTAQEVITFLKGIEFGTYSPGLLGSGGKIDGNGNGELRSLRLWETLEVPELRYNRISVYTGVQWQTFGAGIIESVEIDKDEFENELQSGIITLKLEDGEFGAVAVDDMCQGIYHNFGGVNDTESEDQRNGNFHVKGFSTSYFRITEILDSATNGRFRYVLREPSKRWTQLNHPKPYMHFACYANPANLDRQTCMYTTTEYSIRLHNMNAWEYGEQNIYAIEGKLDGFSLGDTVFTGTGQVIGNGYFYGYIQTIQNDNNILNDSKRVNFQLEQSNILSKKENLLSEVNNIHNSIYLAYYHKEELEELADVVVGVGGTIDTLNDRINDILLLDETLPDDYRYRYNKARAAYFESLNPLELGIVGAKEAIAAEIKRRADSGAGETQGGGANELREYDMRFDGKYWNNCGFVEIDLDIIEIKKIQFLSDDQNSWADETGRRIIL